MRAPRYSIAALMGVALVAAIGLAGLRYQTEITAGVTFLLTCGVLALAVVGVVCRGEAERAWWLGFALFGWGYMALVFWFPLDYSKMPTKAALEALVSNLGPPGGVQRSGGWWWIRPTNLYLQIGHCVSSIMAAALGGLLARALFGAPAGCPDSLCADGRPAGQRRRWLWRWSAACGLVGLALLTSVASLKQSPAPGVWVWAGAIFLVTCGLTGLGVLGALYGHGRGRAIWLGAALFGAGYMFLIFGPRVAWPASYWTIVIDRFLDDLRPWLPSVLGKFPASSASVAAANARIAARLEQPFSIRFPDETPLADVLEYIQIATRDPDGRGIPIYVDPAGLQEAEKTMQSPLVIDLDGVPLKTILRLALRQLGLVYGVRDGVLLITESTSEGSVVYEDPYLVVGHCLLALIAAGVGSLAAILVYDHRREPTAQEKAPVIRT